ncbi:wd g-beta repeat-containing, partial [Cystoisospora suis]
VHIYSTRTYKLLRTLYGGSLRGYTCAAFRGIECFSSGGDAAPDIGEGGIRNGEEFRSPGKGGPTSREGASSAGDVRSDTLKAPDIASGDESFELADLQSEDGSRLGRGEGRRESAQQGVEGDGKKTGDGPTVPTQWTGGQPSNQDKGSPASAELSSAALKQSAADASQSNFNSSRTVILAAVGCEPDYYLTLWNVYQGTALLRFKASGQEVSTVGWYGSLEATLESAAPGPKKEREAGR